MNVSKITPGNLNFLKALKKNNNRKWFDAHKANYLFEHEHIIAFAEALLWEMNSHDHIETASGKKSLHRIYCDVRFSHDKTPYHTHWGGSFSRATKKLRGGYYYHIEPGNTFIAGGFWRPDPPDLKRIRDEIAYDAAALRKIITSKKFIKAFGAIRGEKIKTSPKGFSSNHPAIDLLRYKQFIIKHKFSDKETLSGNFLKEVNAAFKMMRPFFDYMSEVLTTDTNGISII